MMKYYEYLPNSDQYESFEYVAEGDRYKASLLSIQRVKAKGWQPPRLKIGCKGERADFVYAPTSVVFSGRAVMVLQTLLRNQVQFLPVRAPHGSYYLVTVLSKSTKKQASKRGLHIFQNSDGDNFVSKQFVDVAVATGLEGLYLEHKHEHRRVQPIRASKPRKRCIVLLRGEIEIRMSGAGPGATRAELSLLEKRLNLRLPEALVTFLQECDGGFPSHTLIKKNKTPYYVEWFFCMNDILWHFTNVTQNLLSRLIPFATDPGGSLFLVSCDKLDSDAIYYWDHERETLYPSRQRPLLQKVAGNMEEFLKSLQRGK